MSLLAKQLHRVKPLLWFISETAVFWWGKVISVDLAMKTSCEFWTKHHSVGFSWVSISSLVSSKKELLLKWELGESPTK